MKKKKQRLIWQIYPAYLFIIILSLLAATWYATNSLQHFFLDNTAEDLAMRSLLLKEQIIQLPLPDKAKEINRICRQAGKNSSTRFTVILPDGKVMADSEELPDNMDNHADRPEIITAFTGQTGRAVRYSRTLKQKMMYVAVPLKTDQKLHSIIRASLSLAFIDDKIKSIQLKIAAGGICITLLAAIISLFIARRISRPLEDLKNGAQHFARGDLTFRLPSPKAKEMADLAEAMNHMAVELDKKIKIEIKQRNETEAILTGMFEGVIAVDNDEKILNINQAALRMFDRNVEPKGKSIQEFVRNHELHKFIKKTLATGDKIEGDIFFRNNETKILNACSTPLYDSGNSPVGAILVINDVSKLRQLENIRRDFVANVSHEIKTPLTAIKGFVETLQDITAGGSKDIARFLTIIERHVNRLTTIINDLLQLSEIEQQNKINRIELQEGSINDVIKAVICTCRQEAAEKRLQVEFKCEEQIIAKIDPGLLEQAFINLLDNAIKYSNENSKVEIEILQQKKEILILFKDYGIGILKKHLPRLFERFYRVEPARSRKLGGTGLGLAIVKHIVRVHDGTVTVKSIPGKGSIFTVHLPIN